MAKITFGFEQPRKDGKRKVVFTLSHRGGRKRIPVDIELSPRELTKDSKGNVKVKSVEKRFEIDQTLNAYNEKLHQIRRESVGVELTVDEVYSYLVRKKKSVEIDFFSFAEDWLSKSDIKGKKNYTTMLNSIKKYVGAHYLPFSEIDYKFLTSYSASLKDRPRAQSLYLGAIRHIHNKARLFYNTDEHAVISPMTFERFKVPRQKLKKGVRALSQEDLMKVYQYQGNGRAQLARDCFVLSFCLMGMNSVDMYECSDRKDDTICYKRTKTKGRRSDEAYIEVNVHPFIRHLMDKYKGATRVFDFYKRYSSAADFNRALNIGLKAVGKAVGIDGLQFYQARHTFATLSRNLMRFSKSDVDEALNHVGAMGIADVYIAKDFTIINDNNRKLIDTVFCLS